MYIHIKENIKTFVSKSTMHKLDLGKEEDHEYEVSLFTDETIIMGYCNYC